MNHKIRLLVDSHRGLCYKFISAITKIYPHFVSSDRDIILLVAEAVVCGRWRPRGGHKMVDAMDKRAYWLGVHRLGVDRLGVDRLGVDRLGVDRLGVDRATRWRRGGRVTDWRGIISSSLPHCNGENSAVVFNTVLVVYDARILGRVWC
jgi:hypothetical protein